MKTLALCLVLTIAAVADEPDYKALYLKANAAGAQWKALAEDRARQIEDLRDKVTLAEMRAAQRSEAAVQPETDLGARRAGAVQRIADIRDKAARYGVTVKIPEVAGIPAPAPAAEPATLKPVTLRQTLPGNRWIHLVSFGGPNTHLLIADVQMTFLALRWNHSTKAGKVPYESRGRTLIHDDKLGCKTYFVDDISRTGGTAILEFEHTAESVYHPARSGGGGGGIWDQRPMNLGSVGTFKGNK